MGLGSLHWTHCPSGADVRAPCLGAQVPGTPAPAAALPSSSLRVLLDCRGRLGVLNLFKTFPCGGPLGFREEPGVTRCPATLKRKRTTDIPGSRVGTRDGRPREGHEQGQVCAWALATAPEASQGLVLQEELGPDGQAPRRLLLSCRALGSGCHHVPAAGSWARRVMRGECTVRVLSQRGLQHTPHVSVVLFQTAWLRGVMSLLRDASSLLA